MLLFPSSLKYIYCGVLVREGMYKVLLSPSGRLDHRKVTIITRGVPEMDALPRMCRLDVYNF